MADPINTFVGAHSYWLSFDENSGSYLVNNPDQGSVAIGDDAGDTDLSDGSSGDGVELNGEDLVFDSPTRGFPEPAIYTGFSINGSPVLYVPLWPTGYMVVTDDAGLAGTTGTATFGDFVYPVCLVPGTRITTPAGLCAIESLQIGDLVTTASGAQKPVKWIGRMSIPLSRFNRATATPICIGQGALGNGLPQRDLYVSADHAFAFDGVLVNAGVLVNGTTITRCENFAADVVDYFQVELDDHDLMLAEGAAAETFHDDGHCRAKFDNAAEFHALYPEHVVGAPMAMGRVKLARQLPQALRAKLIGKIVA